MTWISIDINNVHPRLEELLERNGYDRVNILDTNILTGVHKEGGGYKYKTKRKICQALENWRSYDTEWILTIPEFIITQLYAISYEKPEKIRGKTKQGKLKEKPIDKAEVKRWREKIGTCEDSLCIKLISEFEVLKRSPKGFEGFERGLPSYYRNAASAIPAIKAGYRVDRCLVYTALLILERTDLEVAITSDDRRAFGAVTRNKLKYPFRHHKDQSKRDRRVKVFTSDQFCKEVGL